MASKLAEHMLFLTVNNAKSIESVPQRKGDPLLVTQDENPRSDTKLEKLANLKPVMGGVCTAGNFSTENDGAAAVLIMSEQKAWDLKLTPLARIKSCALVGDDPKRAYKTVPVAVQQALDDVEVGLNIEDMDLIEIQEAFAAQVLADLKEMGVKEKDYDKVNVNGSGISLGHPIACTGVRVLVSLVHEMQRRDMRYAL